MRQGGTIAFAGFPDYPLTAGPTLTATDHGYCKQSAPPAPLGSRPPLGLCLEGWGG